LRRRFLTSTMLIALTAIILLGVPLGFVLDRLAREATISRLERSAANIAVAVEPIVSDGRRPSRALLDQLTPPGDRTVLHLADGERIEAGDPPAEPSLSVDTDAGAGAVVELIAPATPVIETVRRSILTLAAVAAVGLVLAGVLATVQARRLTRPIEELARAAHRLGGGDFSARPPRSGVPELDALAETLDSSRERIAALVDAERQFAANASHQLRSALTGLTLRLEELAASPDPGTRAEADEALAQAARLDATIDELLRLARTGRAGERRTFDLVGLVREHVRDWQPRFRREQRGIEMRAEGAVPVQATPGAVGQIVDILLSNALEHGRGGVAFHIRRDAATGVMQVSDEGDGIDPDVAPRLFERADHRQRHGIGLPLARQLAQADRGSLDLLTHRPPVFRLRLPVPDTEGPAPTGAAKATWGTSRR
jgi:signal transduction histidine kinase